MVTTKAPANDPLTAANACGDHTAELANVQVQQEVLRCATAAQEQLMTIHREYGVFRSLVYRIRELTPDQTLSRSQKDFIDAVIRQQEGVDHLATSLTCLLD